MTEPITYEIEVHGHLGCRSLRPFVDDFTVDRLDNGATRLVGKVSDTSHLQGLVTHLASMSIEIISMSTRTPSTRRR